MRKILPLGSTLATLASVKDACSAAYAEALLEAKRSCGRGTYISRGRHFRATRGGELVAGEAECWRWDGTLQGLIEAIDEARFEHRADSLSIEGGIDYALNPRDYGDGAYDAWVSDWAVNVWTKPE